MTSRKGTRHCARTTTRLSFASSSLISMTASTGSWRLSPKRRRCSRRLAGSTSMTGPDSIDTPAAIQRATPLLRTEGLTVRFDGLTALNNVSIAVQPGEIRAIIGPNGAGKSTFFNCVTGVIRPTSGRIVFDGQDIGGLPPHVISKKAIARSYQITNILPGATVLENVRIAAQSRHHSWSLLRHHRAFTDIIDQARAVLASLGLDDKEDELAANLSHGEQRHLE